MKSFPQKRKMEARRGESEKGKECIGLFLKDIKLKFIFREKALLWKQS